MSDKVFRHTPHRAADALKIIVGNKTNATIRDLEETEEDIEELEGVIVSIDKDKMTGDGWKVKTKDGTFDCSCASNMYDLPETEEFGGMYYPKETVKVKMTKNPVLRTNVITEITSLGKNESKIDLSKWKHGDKATTVIAKPKSAISVSDAMISFDYDNKNKVLTDEDGVTTKGLKTKIETDKFDVDTSNLNIKATNNFNLEGNITINNQSIKDFINDINKEIDLDKYKIEETKTNEHGIDIQKSNNLGQLDLNLQDFQLNSDSSDGIEQVITDLKNPLFFPRKTQVRPLSNGQPGELYIHPNGLVTIRTKSTVSNILDGMTWIASEYINKNVLTVTIKQMCDCCDTREGGTVTYFNYCPNCQKWNLLYDDDNIIKCDGCTYTWCQGCGHVKNADCSNTTFDLKKYETRWTISAIGTNCDYCKDAIDEGKTREYANYCPKCKNWGYLTLETETYNNTERHFFRCTHPSCGEKFCVNCGISQGVGFIKNFLDDNIVYEKFIEKFQKITHIRDD